MKPLLLFATLFTLSVGALSAQDDGLPDFLFRTQVDRWSVSSLSLYPELALDRNPSVGMGVDRVLIFPGLSLATSDETTEQTILATNEVIRTSDQSLDLANNAPTGVAFYAPAGQFVAGGLAEFGVFRRTITETDTGTNETTTDRNERDYIGLEGLFALNISQVDAGVQLVYSADHDPVTEEFQTLSGEAGSPETYYPGGGSLLGTGNDDGPKYATDTTAFAGTVGATTGFGSTTLGLGVRLAFTTVDRSTGYVPDDEDNDGFDDRIITERASAEEAGGYYDYRDTEASTQVILYPHAFYPLSGSLQLLGSGYWYAWDQSISVFYDRAAAGDQNQTTRTADGSFATFGLLAGVEWTPIRRLEVRAGIGYELDSTRYSQEELDASGGSTFSAQNPDNHTEVNLGAGGEPTDDFVIGFGSRSAATEQIASLPIGVMWNPVERFRFFSSAEFSVAFREEVFNIFNAADATVWTERVSRVVRDWRLDSVVGFAFELSDSITLGMRSEGVASLGGTTITNDTLPTSGGSDSTNIAGALDDTSAPGAFSLDVFLVIGLE